MRLGYQRFTSEVIKLAGIVRGPLIEQLCKVMKDIRTEKRPCYTVRCPFYRTVPVECFLPRVVLIPSSVAVLPDVNFAQAGKRLQEG